MTNHSSTPAAQYCPRCGKPNFCGIAQGLEQCWCMEQPASGIAPAANAENCYCRDCLRELASQPASER